MEQMEHTERLLSCKECRDRVFQANLSALQGTICESRGVEVTGHAVRLAQRTQDRRDAAGITSQCQSHYQIDRMRVDPFRSERESATDFRVLEKSFRRCLQRGRAFQGGSHQAN